jgi:hypothetical protein
VNHGIIVHRPSSARSCAFSAKSAFMASRAFPIRAARGSCGRARLWGRCVHEGACDPAYPDSCIPPPPPDLDCSDVDERRFAVLPPDPHNFDGDRNDIGCEEP